MMHTVYSRMRAFQVFSELPWGKVQSATQQGPRPRLLLDVGIQAALSSGVVSYTRGQQLRHEPLERAGGCILPIS